MEGVDIRNTDRMCISGLPNSGKTVLTRFLASLVNTRHLLIVDPL